MSDLREELEKNFASANMQSEDNDTVNEKESDFVSTPQALEEEEIIAAPKSYTRQFQENFKQLSPEWQKYLLEREKQIEKGFSEMGNKLNASKWPEKFFEERKKRLSDSGFEKAEDYIEKLVLMDDALEENPAQTLKYLAAAYGIEGNNNAENSKTQRQILNDILFQKQAFEKERSDAACFDLKKFEEAVDENGNSKHPFLSAVKHEMISALKGGEAKNLQQAYQKALWLNDEVRNTMIENKIKDVLEKKLDEALKAKEASFKPFSKTEPKERELTLREELEAQFKKEF